MHFKTFWNKVVQLIVEIRILYLVLFNINVTKTVGDVNERSVLKNESLYTPNAKLL